MSESDIRVGKVSSIDYKNGMMRVTYTDKGKSVTANMPYTNFNNEYNMPGIGKKVLVAHLSNGSSRGVVIGPMWNKSNRPTESGSGIYRKDMSTNSTAYQRYSNSSGEYDIVAPNINITAANAINGSASLMEIDVTVKLSVKAKEISINTEDELFAAVKKAVIFAVEEIRLDSEQGVALKAETDLELEDSGWKTTLTKIMERLQELDGDSSDKK